MDDLERTARSAIEEAAPRLRTAWVHSKNISFKGPVDLVTETDRDIETLVTERLRAAFPDHRILGEEATASHTVARPADDEWCWYLDPIDGTVNFAHGIPQFCISLGLGRGRRMELAIVHNPISGDTFTARRSQGALLNGQPIRVSETARLTDALLATGFPYDRREHLERYLPPFAAFMQQARDVRRFGSAALDLCYVACGRFDGYWEWQLHPWDTAAGWLIVEEAGGRVSDFRGAAFDPFAPQTLASNGHLHSELLRVLNAGSHA